MIRQRKTSWQCVMWFFLTVFSFLLVVIAGELIVRAGAVFLPGVKYRATAGTLIGPKEFKTLEEFLSTQSQHLKPYRNWHNYFTNSLGFYDEEFEIPKPDGRFRIMALGDSFCYSVVPYPMSFLTLVEDKLGKACKSPDLDLQNFGIGGTGLWEYKTLLQLGHFFFKPDLVVIHFYMGNDGPDTYRHESELPELKRALLHSYFFTYIKHFFKILSGLETYKLDISTKIFSKKNKIGLPLRGGSVVDPTAKHNDNNPVLTGPTFNEETFNTILAKELGRFYAPGDIEVKKEWGPVLNVFEEIRKIVTNNRMKMAIVLLPSVLQIYPEVRERLIERMQESNEYKDMDFKKIDFNLPNRILLDYCDKAGVNCFDTTPDIAFAAATSEKPLYIKRDTHWNIRGNLVAAIAESKFLEKMVCSLGN